MHTCAVRSRIGSDPTSLVLIIVGELAVSELAVGELAVGELPSQCEIAVSELASYPLWRFPIPNLSARSNPITACQALSRPPHIEGRVGGKNFNLAHHHFFLHSIFRFYKFYL